MKRSLFVSFVVLLIAGAVAWYVFKPGEKANAGTTPKQAAGASVSTVPAKRMHVPVRLEANGNVSSLNSVEVRPQISNVVAKVHIREGQFVKAGDILFTLDDRADRVKLQQAEAQKKKDEASLADFERQLARSRDLVSKGFISQSAVDTVQTQVEGARATLQADKAAIEAARVALSYSTIRASSSGRAGAISVYAGSLVQPSSPPLVTISQLDPIAVTFTLPESELNPLIAAQRTGEVKVIAKSSNAGKPVEGKVSFVDNAVDTQNGTIRVKAMFANAEQLLWPGQYVTVSTIVRELRDAIVIPQAAIITGIDSRTVYIVGPDKTAKAKRIELLYSFGPDAVVKGIEEGEHIVVDGKQNLRPGTKVIESQASAPTGNGTNNANGTQGKQQGDPVLEAGNATGNSAS
jgi:RND family efflux transporter MFP subunit